ncbi:MAG: arylesterase [Verrucomicrobiae bacterium]|nr:arylesterase [Verrucomicrobiae bacterium]
MKRRSFWLMVLLGGAALVGVMVLRPTAPRLTNFPPSATGPWVAFGDSLTEGHGAEPGGDYPSQLSRRLGIPIVNLGRGGVTTGEGLARVDEVVALRPRVVLLCLGGNDVLRQQSSAEMMSNLDAIIERLHHGGSFVVLLGIRSASLRDRNQKAFDRLARDRQVLLVPDLLDGVMFRPELMADPIHPNERGYAKIAERVEQRLAPWLPKLR